MSRLMDLIGGEVVAAGTTMKNGSSVQLLSIKRDHHYYIVEVWSDPNRTFGGHLVIEDIQNPEDIPDS